jgi:hypothetical protein
LTQGGASQFNSTITVGVDGTGYDVIFYGDSASSNMTWDEDGNTDGQLTLNDARLYIDQDEDDMAILIDSEATTETALSVHSKYGIYSNQDISSGRAARFTRNLDEAGSYPLVFIRDDHTSNTQPALSIQQDGDAAHIEFSGVGTGGIKFKASATDSADANTLDDYEEGTWDAVVTDGTNPMTMDAAGDTGYYTKVGNLVTVTGYFYTTSLGSASGNIRITGLPFTIANNYAAHPGGGAAFGVGYAITAGHSVSYYGGINGTNIYLYVWGDAEGVNGMQASEWTLDGQIILGFSYRAA